MNCRTAIDGLFPVHRLTRVIAMLWMLAYVFLLAHELIFLHSHSSPYDFGTAEMRIGIGSIILSFPISLIVFVDLKWLPVLPISFPENGLAGILLTWSIFFVLGYLQWFVLPRGIAHLSRAVNSRLVMAYEKVPSKQNLVSLGVGEGSGQAIPPPREIEAKNSEQKTKG